MQTFRAPLIAIQTVVILLLGIKGLQGAAFDLPDQDAFVIGRGMAFVATADNPSAIYYNPAGITQLEGNNLRAGVYGIDLEPSYKSPFSGQTFDNQSKYHVIPQFYYTYSKKDFPFSFGLGVYSPFGLGVTWPQDTGFRTSGYQGKLSSETINPVVAFKVNSTLSLGGGLMVNRSSINLVQGLTPIPGNDLFQFNGDGWDLGYNLGALWKPIEGLSFGVTFHSGFKINYRGETDAVFPPIYPATSPSVSPATSEWPFPSKVIFGVSYRPTPKWNLEFDADYTDWNVMNTVYVNQASPSLVVPFPTVPVTFNWQSSWYFEWGATHYFDDGWHISGGYIFNQNSLPDKNYSPLVADLDRHFLSLGIGHKGKTFDFDIAYQFGYAPERTVTGSGGFQDGQYKFISHAIAISGGWHF